MQVAQQNIELMGKALFPTPQSFDAGVSESCEVVQSQESVTGANLDYIGSVFAHNLGAFLRTWGKGMRIVSKQIIRLVAVGAVLTATLRPQQTAPRTICSNVLNDEARELGLLRRDASRSVPFLHNGGFQYGSFTYFH